MKSQEITKYIQETFKLKNPTRSCWIWSLSLALAVFAALQYQNECFHNKNIKRQMQSVRILNLSDMTGETGDTVYFDHVHVHHVHIHHAIVGWTWDTVGEVVWFLLLLLSLFYLFLPPLPYGQPDRKIPVFFTASLRDGRGFVRNVTKVTYRRKSEDRAIILIEFTILR